MTKSSIKETTPKVRPATQAGRFYDGNAQRLRAEVDGYLAQHQGERHDGRVAALIVPHAGYYFSGNVAAAAYMSLDTTKTYQRIFLLGPSHHAWLNGASVKTKNNHGRTRKKRMVVEDFTPDETTAFDVQSPLYDDFLRSYLQYDPATLTLQLENRFDRITLVNKAKTERLTIDTNLRFHNITTGHNRFMTDIVIIELKRDGHQPSPILPRLLDLRIHQQGFSKYCIGSALTNDTLSRNRFKPRLHSIDKLLNNK